MRKLMLVAMILLMVTAGMSFAGGGLETPKSQITVKYAYWNLGTPEENNLERRMIAAWNAANPMVKVELASNIDYSKYLESLTTAAAAGAMPDVMGITEFGKFVANDWLADITKQVKADADLKDVSKALVNSVYLNGKAYAIPWGAFMYGFFVNKDLLAKYNIPAPGLNWTLADFQNIVKTLAKPDVPVMGLSEEADIPNWYPIAANKNLGWFTWDGKAYHLDSAEFKAGVDLARSYWKNGYVWESMPKDAKDKIGAGWHGEAFFKGYSALMWNGSWGIGDSKSWTFKWDFVPIPGGKLIFIPDYIGVSSGTKNVGWAYEVAKFMTAYSKKGFSTRMDIAQANKMTIGTLPATKDSAIVDRYLTMVNLPNLKAMYANIDNATVEAFKPVPGYAESRWNAKVTADKSIGDMVWNAVRGDVKFADMATQLNQIANKNYADAMAALPK
jgi:multiple sugar transport system substrate-binding protein